MKNGKSKGRTPSLIGSTLGKPRRVSVERVSKCKRCSAQIEAGQNCVAIPKLGGSFSALNRYCEDCYKNIIKKTQEDLNSLINI